MGKEGPGPGRNLALLVLAVSAVWVVIVLFFWRVFSRLETEDPAQYPETLARWEPERVRHFPRSLDGLDVVCFARHDVHEAWMVLRVRMRPEESRELIERWRAEALHVGETGFDGIVVPWCRETTPPEPDPLADAKYVVVTAPADWSREEAMRGPISIVAVNPATGDVAYAVW